MPEVSVCKIPNKGTDLFQELKKWFRKVKCSIWTEDQVSKLINLFEKLT